VLYRLGYGMRARTAEERGEGRLLIGEGKGNADEFGGGKGMLRWWIILDVGKKKGGMSGGKGERRTSVSKS